VYRVHFKWKEKEISLQARSLDLTHPYFVSIKDLFFPSGSSVIINPSEDDLKREFGEVSNLMIPFQTVTLIEEMPESERARLMPFSLLDRKAPSEDAGELESPDADERDEDTDTDGEVKTW